MLETGQNAPEIRLPRDGGDIVDLSDYRGQPVVVYFYPRDNTSGCTMQAQAFTEHLPEFKDAGAVVLGVSKDTVAKHDKFRDKHGLEVPLLSDAEGDTCERYGVWVEKSMYGKTFWGIVRTTFLIDRAGKIARIWPKVKVKGHVDDVLSAVRSL